ncbi:TPA_asm: RNA-directed RNA polymerase [ssRNA phage SRR7976299_14]|uniref:RNA-directed RNA polymerase n=1 Tax=ssRNA phage SRR7976299_14 TaxID=2786636 RepID=A0A8S5L153_9VIRU|nr:RNA-directed RNA polymerase [ssRNA phage SRR7976299_14]DAD51069.1 TPA_asm: RNA-directed RNA polymerase [ssRNA phage SRR7976299_14]
MSTTSKKRKRRSAVSFTGFLKAQIRAIRLLSCQLSEQNGIPVDLRLKAFAVADCLERGDFAGAVELSDSLASQQYGTAGEHALGVQIAYLVRKVPYVDPELDPQQAATQKFLDAEVQCGETNRRLRPLNRFIRGEQAVTPDYFDNLSWNTEDVGNDVLRVIMAARKYVQDVIGAKPNIEDVLERARFSAGTAIGVTGNCTHIVAKLAASEYTVTRCAEPYGTAFLGSLHLVSEYLTGKDPDLVTRVAKSPYNGSIYRDTSHLERKLSYVEFDKIFFVLKQATTHRTVGQQPLLNLLIQLGAGDVIEQKLSRRANISLKYGWKQNQQHAYEGSVGSERDWCTVDLRAASDSIAIEFARLLLPDAWFYFLNCIRTPMYLLPGASPVRYEKFCAMGNGFCFPLETLLFKALTHGVNTTCNVPDYAKQSAVYGDDITVHPSAALLLLETLELCGFETNKDKTFLFGPFRESCGKDYFGGTLVRPYVQDKIPENWYDLIHVVNSFSRLGRPEVAEVFQDAIPPRNRLYRPEYGPSHTAIEEPLDRFLTRKESRWNKDLQRWSWVEYRLIPVKDETEYAEPLQLIGALCGAMADWSQIKDGSSPFQSWSNLHEASDHFSMKWKVSEGAPQLPLRREARTVKVRVYAPDKSEIK